jgi:predicted nucleic acid-binding protein
MSFMSAKGPQFVDTNVLVYAHDSSAGSKHERARTLLQALWRDRTGGLSIQVLQEFYVTTTRKVARPLTPEASAQIISDLAVWQVHRPDVNDVLEAIQLQARWQISFWDAMILTSARKLGCALVWSEDLGSGVDYAGVLVRNPFE